MWFGYSHSSLLRERQRVLELLAQHDDALDQITWQCSVCPFNVIEQHSGEHIETDTCPNG
jgi:hypothetical protein